MSDPAFVPARPEDQAFVPARPEDQQFVPARPEDTAHPQPSVPFWAQDPRRNLEEAKGFVKGIGQTLAGVVNMANRPILPGAVRDPNAPLVPEVGKATKAIEDRSQPNNPYQQEGTMAEMVAELMAMPEEAVEAGAGKVLTLADHLTKGAKMAKFLSEHPGAARAVRIGMDAVKGATRAGVEQGAQTAVKTGDVDKAAEAAVTGAAFGRGRR